MINKRQFQHMNVTYTVYSMTVLQQDMLTKTWLDFMQQWWEAHGYSREDYPLRHDPLSMTYISYMMTTEFDGEPPFPVVNPILSNGNLASAYDQWCEAILKDRDLQDKWQTAYEAVNGEASDPEVESGAPTGDDK